MSDILATIATYKRAEIAAAKRQKPYARLDQEARNRPPTRKFRSALASTIARGQPALIAEIKKASPSQGLIRADFNVAALAGAYQAGGATCLSVLTDKPSFAGRPEYLLEAHRASTLPVLRKDFLYDPYQVVEARALGADCILIIMAAVEDAVARDLEAVALEWDMDVLVEIHDERELDRALSLRSRLVGINNRDLTTFATALGTSERLAPRIPAGYVVVSESGLRDRADLARLQAVGISAFLIGESLMREADVEAATRILLAPLQTPRSSAAR